MSRPTHLQPPLRAAWFVRFRELTDFIPERDAGLESPRIARQLGHLHNRPICCLARQSGQLTGFVQQRMASSSRASSRDSRPDSPSASRDCPRALTDPPIAARSTAPRPDSRPDFDPPMPEHSVRRPQPPLLAERASFPYSGQRILFQRRLWPLHFAPRKSQPQWNARQSRAAAPLRRLIELHLPPEYPPPPADRTPDTLLPSAPEWYSCTSSFELFSKRQRGVVQNTATASCAEAGYSEQGAIAGHRTGAIRPESHVPSAQFHYRPFMEIRIDERTDISYSGNRWMNIVSKCP